MITSASSCNALRDIPSIDTLTLLRLLALVFSCRYTFNSLLQWTLLVSGRDDYPIFDQDTLPGRVLVHLDDGR